MTLAGNPLQREMLEAVEHGLKQSVGELTSRGNDQLREMIVHHFGWEDAEPTGGGKRVRPLLTLLVCDTAGGEWRSAIPAAISAEFIHNFSLIHDDIQDQSHTRRGRITVWKKWGEAQAINAGDALFALARLASYGLRETGLPAEVVLAVQRDFDRACLELTRGQYLDLAYEDLDSVSPADYLQMVEAKTASLLAACAAAGARIAGASETVIAEYRAYAIHLGIAFQIHDDVLGIWGDPSITGKPAGDDLQAQKKSYPILCGLESSERFRDAWQGGGREEGRVEAMIEMLEHAGAKAAAQRAAEQHTEKALHHLESASPGLAPANPLSNLTQALLRRQE